MVEEDITGDCQAFGFSLLSHMQQHMGVSVHFNTAVSGLLTQSVDSSENGRPRLKVTGVKCADGRELFADVVVVAVVAATVVVPTVYTQLPV